MNKKLYRSKSDRKLLGICGGMAEYFQIDPTIVRLIWALATVFGFAGLLAYIVCALVIPERGDDNVIDSQ